MARDCRVCGGKGFRMEKIDGSLRRVACKECGGVRNFRDKLEAREPSDRDLAEYIPNAYFRAIEFDRAVLEKEIPVPMAVRDIYFEVYYDFMEKMIATLRMGQVPKKSYIVTAPDNFGKKVFVYSMIKNALRGNLKPTELIDSRDVYDQLDHQNYAQLKEWFNADIAFMTLGGAPAKSDAISIKTVLDICERKGIPLIVLSRFNGSYFTKFDSLMAASVGVKATKDGDYGRLEQQGIFGDTLNAVREYYNTQLGGSVKNYKDAQRRG